jgi:GT2 family glycosyltransferase
MSADDDHTSETRAGSATVSVIIATYNRPDCLGECLRRLAGQSRKPEQIIVVDASPDDLTRRTTLGFAEASYFRNPRGRGHMTVSRNIGLSHATGDIIAFLDDDAFAAPDWLERLTEPYADPSVGAVGGRALNKQPDEERTGVDKVGRLDRNGVLHGYFAADTGKPVEVDHIIGCNMSFRRSVLAELGGLRDDYPGTEVREETDLAFRVRARGYKIVFTPHAVVDHIGAPQAVGRRFDLRYAYYAQRNHLVLLLRNFGPASPVVWRNLGWSLGAGALDAMRRIAGACARILVTGLGTISGLCVGIALLARDGTDPIRRDRTGRVIGVWPADSEPQAAGLPHASTRLKSAPVDQ